MNEEELKKIWRKEEAIPLKKIDMEYIQNYASNTQTALQKLNIRQIITGAVVAAIVLLDFIYSDYFYLVLSLVAITFVYLIWQTRRDHQADRVRREESIRNYLVFKEKKISREIMYLRTGIFLGFFCVPLISFIQKGTLDFLTTNPLLYISVLTVGVLTMGICTELYIRRNYYPNLEDLRYLIEELDGKNDNSE